MGTTKSFRKKIQISIFLPMLLIAFQNCSPAQLSYSEEGVGSQRSIASTGGAIFATPPPSSSPPAPPLVINCEEAKKAGRISVTGTEVVFNTTGQSRLWGEDGNLSKLNDYVRARVEEHQLVSIPTDVTVCDVKLEHRPAANFLYDDNVLINLNGYILASTSDFTRYFAKQKSYYKYDWSRVINRPAQHSPSDSSPDRQYCAGKSEGLSQCLFPVTEETGRIDLQIDKSVIQDILALTSPNQVRLSVVTFGDDDKTDCQHTPIRLSVQVEYFHK